MAEDTVRGELRALMGRINRSWLEGSPHDLAALAHPAFVMRHPGFGELSVGSARLVEGFVEFREAASVQSFDEADHQVDVVGDTAVVSYRFEMLYALQAERRRSTGRDLWIFQRQGAEWLAVWRTMLDLQDEAASGSAA